MTTDVPIRAWTPIEGAILSTGELVLRNCLVLFFGAMASVAFAQAPEAPRLVYPLIHGHGGIVALPDAAQQPRRGSKVVLDVTRGSRADGVLVALDRVARYVNLYAHADAGFDQGFEMAVVMHGGATKASLSDAAFREHFGVANPDSALIQQLSQAGVRFYVCGQSLMHSGYQPEETSEQVQVAVAAATALIELQRDGYSFMPLQ